MTDTQMVALLSGDLMFGSQIQAVLGPARIVVANSSDPEMLPITDVVFIDLNSRAEERVATIARWREENPEATLVGFCHHGDKQLRRQAMEAGATYVIANRFLPEAALRLATTADRLEVAVDDEP